ESAYRQNCQPVNDGKCSTGKRAGLIARPIGPKKIHHLPPPPESRQSKPAAQDFSQAGKIRLEFIKLLGTAESYAETRDDFVVYQKRAIGVCNFSHCVEKSWRRWNHSHVAADGLYNNSRDIFSVSVELTLQ